MSLRQPLPLWTIVTALLASVIAGQLAYRHLHPTDPGPRTIAELRQRLDGSGLDLVVVPTTDTSEEAGVYLCISPQPRQRLQRLLRITEMAQRWKGVVFCSHEGGVARIPEDVVRGWGEHGMQLGELLFFGDPVLLERIRQAVSPAGCSDRGSPRPAANLVARPNSRLSGPAFRACHPLISRKGEVSCS